MTSDAPDQSNAQDIIRALDTAIDGLWRWTVDWHTPLVTGRRAADGDIDFDLSCLNHLDAFDDWFDKHRDETIVNQPNVRRLREISTEIRSRASAIAVAGDHPDEATYHKLMSGLREFVQQARRLERAFATAAADIDALTGVQNRLAMRRALDYEKARIDRGARSVIVALVDLDHFKRVNDEHGHAAGDTVLVAASGRLVENSRTYDQVFRYGGEEFLLLMPDTSADAATTSLERHRSLIAGAPIVIDDGTEVSITASFGAAELKPDRTVQETLERADAALYRAKESGRNRVVIGD